MAYGADVQFRSSLAFSPDQFSGRRHQSVDACRAAGKTEFLGKVGANPAAAEYEQSGFVMRRFSRKDRMALYVLAQGRCAECGKPLDRTFHADHKKPWSRGGATMLSNGDALCSSCNLIKGASDARNTGLPDMAD